jgi:2'-5' RNA ligase
MPQSDTRVNQKPLANHADELRVFFALWPSPAIQQQLHTIAKQLQPQCNARVMRTETLHLTLQFIGNIKRVDLPKLTAAASKVASPPFTLQFEKIAFWQHNGIAYATLKDDAPILNELVSALKIQLAEEGVVYADSKFSPHVTLMRNVEQTLQAHDFAAIKWQVDSFVLVESEITDQGAHYKTLHQWPLTLIQQ